MGNSFLASFSHFGSANFLISKFAQHTCVWPPQLSIPVNRREFVTGNCFLEIVGSASSWQQTESFGQTNLNVVDLVENLHFPICENALTHVS